MCSNNDKAEYSRSGHINIINSQNIQNFDKIRTKNDEEERNESINENLIKLSSVLFPNIQQGCKCRVLFPFCGNSADIMYVANLGYEVVAVEHSSLAVTKFFKEENLLYFLKTSNRDKNFQVYRSKDPQYDITIYQGDFLKCGQKLFNKVDVVWDNGLWMNIKPKERFSYVKCIKDLVHKNTKYCLENVTYSKNGHINQPISCQHNQLLMYFSNYFNVQRLYYYEDDLKRKIYGVDSFINTYYLLTLRTCLPKVNINLTTGRVVNEI